MLAYLLIHNVPSGRSFNAAGKLVTDSQWLRLFWLSCPFKLVLRGLAYLNIIIFEIIRSVDIYDYVHGPFLCYLYNWILWVLQQHDMYIITTPDLWLYNVTKSRNERSCNLPLAGVSLVNYNLMIIFWNFSWMFREYIAHKIWFINLKYSRYNLVMEIAIRMDSPEARSGFPVLWDFWLTFKFYFLLLQIATTVNLENFLLCFILENFLNLKSLAWFPNFQ